MNKIPLLIHYSKSIENEYFYEKLSYFLIHSNDFFNNPFKIFILSLSTKIDPFIKKFFKKKNCEIIEDPRFDNGYYLRNFSIIYFWKIFKQKFLYVDIDVLISKFDENFLNFFKNFKNSILTETVPQIIIDKIESNYGVSKLNFPLYYNWIQIINEDNYFIYDIDYNKYKNLKESDIEISRNIYKSNLNKIEQNIGTYYPKHDKLNYFFHFDGLIDSGTFYRLKNYNKKLYFYLLKKIQKEPDFKGIFNEPNYYSRMGINL